MHQFGPPFGSIPMQSAMSGGMFPVSSAAAPFAHGAGPLAQSVAPAAGLGGNALRGGGGLLARLFGGGAAQSAGSALMGGGATSAATGGMNFTTMLTNAQRIVGLGQQVMPMVQQYGPLIRNMPMIWKIMRSSNSEPTEDVTVGQQAGETDEEVHAQSPSPSPEQEGKGIQITEQEESSLETAIQQDSQQPIKRKFRPQPIAGIPTPKLYV